MDMSDKTERRSFLPRALLIVLAGLAVMGMSPGPSDGGDAAGDAAGAGQLFESVAVKGVTDVRLGTDGVTLADFNRDGLLDKLLVHGGGPRAQIRLLLNRGDLGFSPSPLSINGAAAAEAATAPGGAGVGAAADFNGDGFLDVYLVMSGGSALDREGKIRSARGGGLLLLSAGGFNRFREASAPMGLIASHPIYERQATFGDVNADGFLDIAVAADNIGNAWTGLPWQRLMVYRPAASGRYEDGRFEDIGGTDVIPGFGGQPNCQPLHDKGGPNIALLDVDGDGDLDLVQTYQNDMTTGAPWHGACASANMLQGMFAWKNLLKETGDFRFERITTAPFDRSCHFTYNQEREVYDYVGHCLSHPYQSWFDYDNDGDLDFLTLGVLDYTWHVDSDRQGVSFHRNEGNFRFTEVTAEAGLEPLQWNYGQWNRFWKANIPRQSTTGDHFISISQQKPHLSDASVHTVMAYSASVIPGDFDNDGWVDLIYVNRHELDGAWGELRNVLFRNDRGYFRPTTTEYSGIDTNSIGGDAADLDNDGLLDLVLNLDPDHSYHNPDIPIPGGRYLDRVFHNAGAQGARAAHWLRVRFTGASDAVLMKAMVRAYAPGTRTLLGARLLTATNAYKAGSAIEAHFGLGPQARVDLELTPPGYRPIRFENLKADEIHTLAIPADALRR